MFIKIKQLQNNLHLLKGWVVNYDNQSKYKGQMGWNLQAKTATLYAWEPESDTPKTFLLHELLHICIKEIDGATDKEKSDKEEILIQDICSLIEKGL